MRKELFGLPIDYFPLDETLRKVAIFVASGKPHQITTVNAEFVMLSRKNAEFKQAIQEADLNVADGSGITIAQTARDRVKSKNPVMRALATFAVGIEHLIAPQSIKYPRISGVELTEHIMKRAANEGWKVYLLGGLPGVAKRAAEVWQAKYPGLIIVGATDDNPGDDHTVTNIKHARPDILFVAYGAPKQDLFIYQHKHELKVPVMIGVGGTFDTLIGTKYNPPRWMKVLGLEWLAYLIRYPSRWKRIWRSTVGFFWFASTHRD